jgi:hypothetical protein
MSGNQKAEYSVEQLDSITFAEDDSSGGGDATDPSVTGDAIDITNKSATLVGYATSIRDNLSTDLRVGFIYCLEGTPNKSNGNSIFLPAAGYCAGTSLYHAGSNGGYWSRSLRTICSDDGHLLYFDSSNLDTGRFDRPSGLSVRPVRVQK